MLGVALGKPVRSARLAVTTMTTHTQPLLEAGEKLYHRTNNLSTTRRQQNNRHSLNCPASAHPEVQEFPRGAIKPGFMATSDGPPNNEQ